MRKLTRRGSLAALLAACCATCGDDHGAVRLQLQIHESLRTQVRSLRITVLSRGRDNELWRAARGGAQTVMAGGNGIPAEVTLVVPAAVRGQLLVGVSGLDDAEHEIVSGRAQATIEEAMDSSKLAPVAVALTQPHCLTDGWCWSHPGPQGQHISGVWGSAPDNVWAVGTGGAILHYDGVGWNGVASPTATALYGVHGSGPSDIWAVGAGAGTTLHYDGNSWVPVANPGMQTLRAVYAVAPSSAWAVGAAGTVLRYQGSDWRDVSVAGGKNLFGVWAASADDAFVVGDGGAARYRAGSWDPMVVTPPVGPPPMPPAMPVPADLRGVWGTGANDIFFVGPAGVLLHWNGGVFDNITALSGMALSAIGGSAADDLWALGAGGTLLHRSQVAPGASSSQGWRTVESYTGSALSGVWAAGRDQAWATGNDGALLRWDGGRWTNTTQRETSALLTSVHASGDAAGGVVWAVGERGTLLRWNGVSWEPTPIDSTEVVRDVWSDGPERAWAVGSGGLLLRWDGQRWLRVDSGERGELLGLFGTHSGNLWAAGRGGVLLHFDGTRWMRTSVTTGADINDLWGRGDNDIWAVGGGGTVLHWDGQSWQVANQGVPAMQNLQAVWGTDTALFAVGSNGTLLRREGDSFQALPTTAAAGTGFVGVWGRAADDVWLAGADGRLYRWNGSALSVASAVVPTEGVGGPRTLGRLRGDAVGRLWVVGSQGTIVRAPAVCGNCGASSRSLRLDVALEGFAAAGEVKRLTARVQGGRKPWPGGAIELVPGRTSYVLAIPRSLPNPVTVDVTAYGAAGGEVGAGRLRFDLGPDGDAVPRGVRVRAGCGGDGWCQVASPTMANLMGVWGADRDAVWAAGDGGTLLRWDGQAWAAEPAGVGANLRAVWGTARDDVWATGEPQGTVSTVLHRDGTRWQPQAVPALRFVQLTWVAGVSVDRSTLYAASGSDGSLVTMAGGGWSLLPSQGEMFGCGVLAGMAGVPGGDVWAVGASCAMRLRGGSWEGIAPAPSSALTAVWGSGAQDVWAVGVGGTLYHWDGSRGVEWAPKPTTQTLRSVWGSAADDIWAVGAGDTILHYDGRTWEARRSGGRGVTLNGVWGSGRDDVWIVGQNGTLLRWRP